MCSFRVVSHAAGSPRPSAEPITEVIAERVRDLREKSGLSQFDLAERVRSLGLPWKRATVVNLETRAPNSRGKGAGRDVVTVQELLVLALALDVPPVWLLANPESGEKVQLAANLESDPWSVLLWLIGRAALAEDPGAWWNRVAPSLGLISAYQSAIEQLRRNQASQLLLASDPGMAEHMDTEDELAEKDRRALRALAASMTSIDRSGLTLPPVPDDIVKRASELGVQLPGGD